MNQTVVKLLTLALLISMSPAIAQEVTISRDPETDYIKVVADIRESIIKGVKQAANDLHLTPEETQVLINQELDRLTLVEQLEFIREHEFHMMNYSGGVK